MSTLYELNGGFWTGLSREVEAHDPRPFGWIETDDQPPDVSGGDGALWTTAGWVVAPLPAPPPPAVPSEVTMFQARAALLGAGLLTAVDSAITDMGDPAATLAWEYATTVTRHGQLVAAVASIAGMTDEQLDDLFRNAATIEA